MCDCGCDHAITEYDAGQTPIIIQRGNLLLEIRVLPGPTGERPNVRPVCARAAVTEGTVLFPRTELIVDPGVEEAAPAPAAREIREPDGDPDERAVSVEPDVLVGAGTASPKLGGNGSSHPSGTGVAGSNGNGHGNGNGKAPGPPKPVVRPMKGWHRRG